MDASEQAALAYFPSDYPSARARFLALAHERGAHVRSHPIRARGPGGDTLSIDTAYLGAAEPRRLLLISSGTHGAEGFAGSALQQQWLARYTPGRMAAGDGCLLVHALNPYGFSWLRRANENNIDLNRNALVGFPGPPNPAYRRLDHWLNPPSPPRRIDAFLAKGMVLLLRHGFVSLQQAIVAGQYEYPRGLFYGGERTEESTEIFLRLLRDPRWRSVDRLVAIDIHTGIGRFATYKLMVDFAPDSAPYHELQRWFGAASVVSNRPGAFAYRVSGGLTERIAEQFAGRCYPAVLEFGTAPVLRVIAALRRENRAHYYAAAESAERRRAQALMREVFCPPSLEWRRRILAQGEAVLAQAERACFSRVPGAGAAAPPSAE